jgi:hypothetical protein
VNLRDFGQRLIPNELTIWIVDAHRDDGKRFVARAETKVPAMGVDNLGNARLKKGKKANSK